MKALVTGATGFIGSHLVEALNSQSWEVVAFVRESSSHRNLEGLSYETRVGSLFDRDSIQRALADVDYIFHLAGAIEAPSSKAFLETNRDGNSILAEEAAKAPRLKKLVAVSSLAASGPSHSRDQMKTEEMPDRPVSDYGRSKLAGEKMLLEKFGSQRLSIVRPPIVYGPRDRNILQVVEMIASSWVRPRLNGKFYSSIYVKDLCKGMIQAATQPTDAFELYYLSSNEAVSFQEMLNCISKQFSQRALELPVPNSAIWLLKKSLQAIGGRFKLGSSIDISSDKISEIEPNFWICSNEKAKSRLKFEPRYEFSEGMTETVDWYKASKWI